MSQRGQIVIEYILLLIVAVTLAVLLISQFIEHGGKPEESGVILRMWQSFIQTIGSDYSDGPGE